PERKLPPSCPAPSPRFLPCSSLCHLALPWQALPLALRREPAWRRTRLQLWQPEQRRQPASFRGRPRECPPCSCPCRRARPSPARHLASLRPRERKPQTLACERLREYQPPIFRRQELPLPLEQRPASFHPRAWRQPQALGATRLSAQRPYRASI